MQSITICSLAIFYMASVHVINNASEDRSSPDHRSISEFYIETNPEQRIIDTENRKLLSYQVAGAEEKSGTSEDRRSDDSESSSSGSQSARATAARERAEIAVSEERWCDAAHEFLMAYEYSSPTVREALLNAAVAARRAQDLELAASLYERFVSSHPVHRHRKIAEKRAEELRLDIADKGPGISCPPAPVFEPSPGTITVRSEPPLAGVTVNNVFVGLSPQSIEPDSFDFIDIRVEAPERIPFEIRVNPTLDDSVVNARLQPIPTPVKKPVTDKEDLLHDSDSLQELEEKIEPADPVETFSGEIVKDTDRRNIAQYMDRSIYLTDPAFIAPGMEKDRDRIDSRPKKTRRRGWVLLAIGTGLASGGGTLSYSSLLTERELLSYAGGKDSLPDREFDRNLQEMEKRYELFRYSGGAGIAIGGTLVCTGLILLIIDGINR